MKCHKDLGLKMFWHFFCLFREIIAYSINITNTPHFEEGTIKTMPIINPYMFSVPHISLLASKIGCDVDKIISDNVIRCFIYLINEDDIFHNKWILKGRSGLNTSHLEQNFRLSEDLDYTIREFKEILDLDQIVEKIERICCMIENKTCQAIKFEKPELDVKSGREKGKARYVQLNISYTILDIPAKKFKLKIEGSSLEKVLDPIPDGPFYGLELVIAGQNYSPRIKTYSHQEFFAEKLRGL